MLREGSRIVVRLGVVVGVHTTRPVTLRVLRRELQDRTDVAPMVLMLLLGQIVEVELSEAFRKAGDTGEALEGRLAGFGDLTGGGRGAAVLVLLGHRVSSSLAAGRGEGGESPNSVRRGCQATRGASMGCASDSLSLAQLSG